MTDSRYDPGPGLTSTTPDGEGPMAEPSTLELLKHAADAEAARLAEQDKGNPVVLVGPGNQIRLVCERITDYDQIKAAQRSALPRNQARKPIPDWSDMDPILVHSRLIAEQTREILVFDNTNGDGYRKVVRDGETLDFADPRLLAEFGTADSGEAVRRIFVKDNLLLQAGQQLIEESGWGEDALADAEDPPRTRRRRGARRLSTG